MKKGKTGVFIYKHHLNNDIAIVIYTLNFREISFPEESKLTKLTINISISIVL